MYACLVEFMISKILCQSHCFIIYKFVFRRYSGSKAFLIAFTCTFFEMFNIPVFWPILVMYFCILFVLTMKRQIKVSVFLLYSLW